MIQNFLVANKPGALPATRRSARHALLLAISVVAGSAFAQAPGAKLVRMVTVEPGGVSDLVARMLAQDLTGVLGRTVIVENHGGASGLLAIQAVLKAPADGDTLLAYTNTLWISPLLQSVPYDPVKDFVPITLAVSSPNVLVVHPSLPVKSVKELIVLAKAHPGELNYASGVTGSTAHLAGELFKAMARVDIVRVPYKGSGPALNALLAGQVQLMFAVPASGMAQVKSGRVRALAVTSARPSALAPGLPTLASSGLPGYETVTSTGVLARTGTPEAIVERLNQDMVRFLSRPDVKEKLLNAGAETVASSPEQFAAVIRGELTKWSKLIKQAGIRAD